MKTLSMIAVPRTVGGSAYHQDGAAPSRMHRRRARWSPRRPGGSVEIRVRGRLEALEERQRARVGTGGEDGGDDRIRTGDRGFADPCLTTWLRRPGTSGGGPLRMPLRAGEMERKTGFEPATFSLARRRATTAPLPLEQLRSLRRPPGWWARGPERRLGREPHQASATMRWCRGGDSNSYAHYEHSALNAACLPVPPPRHRHEKSALAGVEGLEPTTCGFGDRCSPN